MLHCHAVGASCAALARAFATAPARSLKRSKRRAASPLARPPPPRPPSLPAGAALPGYAAPLPPRPPLTSVAASAAALGLSPFVSSMLAGRPPDVAAWAAIAYALDHPRYSSPTPLRPPLDALTDALDFALSVTPPPAADAPAPAGGAASAADGAGTGAGVGGGSAAPRAAPAGRLSPLFLTMSRATRKLLTVRGVGCPAAVAAAEAAHAALPPLAALSPVALGCFPSEDSHRLPRGMHARVARAVLEIASRPAALDALAHEWRRDNATPRQLLALVMGAAGAAGEGAAVAGALGRVLTALLGSTGGHSDGRGAGGLGAYSVLYMREALPLAERLAEYALLAVRERGGGSPRGRAGGAGVGVGVGVVADAADAGAGAGAGGGAGAAAAGAARPAAASAASVPASAADAPAGVAAAPAVAAAAPALVASAAPAAPAGSLADLSLLSKHLAALVRLISREVADLGPAGEAEVLAALPVLWPDSTPSTPGGAAGAGGDGAAGRTRALARLRAGPLTRFSFPRSGAWVPDRDAAAATHGQRLRTLDGRGRRGPPPTPERVGSVWRSDDAAFMFHSLARLHALLAALRATPGGRELLREGSVPREHPFCEALAAEAAARTLRYLAAQNAAERAGGAEAATGGGVAAAAAAAAAAARTAGGASGAAPAPDAAPAPSAVPAVVPAAPAAPAAAPRAGVAAAPAMAGVSPAAVAAAPAAAAPAPAPAPAPDSAPAASLSLLLASVARRRVGPADARALLVAAASPGADGAHLKEEALVAGRAGWLLSLPPGCRAAAAGDALGVSPRHPAALAAARALGTVADALAAAGAAAGVSGPPALEPTFEYAVGAAACGVAAAAAPAGAAAAARRAAGSPPPPRPPARGAALEAPAAPAPDDAPSAPPDGSPIHADSAMGRLPDRPDAPRPADAPPSLDAAGRPSRSERADRALLEDVTRLDRTLYDLTLDVAWPAARVALEVDGAYHFCAPPPAALAVAAAQAASARMLPERSASTVRVGARGTVAYELREPDVRHRPTRWEAYVLGRAWWAVSGPPRPQQLAAGSTAAGAAEARAAEGGGGRAGARAGARAGRGGGPPHPPPPPPLPAPRPPPRAPTFTPERSHLDDVRAARLAAAGWLAIYLPFFWKYQLQSGSNPHGADGQRLCPWRMKASTYLRLAAAEAGGAAGGAAAAAAASDLARVHAPVDALLLEKAFPTLCLALQAGARRALFRAGAAGTADAAGARAAARAGAAEADAGRPRGGREGGAGAAATAATVRVTAEAGERVRGVESMSR